MAVCLLHLLWISSSSFWFDELFTAGSALEQSLSHAFERWYFNDLNSPPLYSLLTLLVGRIVGVDEFKMRFPSWLFVTANCLFLSAAPTRDTRARRLAGLLLAVTPFAFVYAQEARSYGLLLLESTIVLLAYMRFTQEHRLSPVFLIGVLVASLTHYFGLLFGGMLLMLAFVTLVRRGALKEAAKAIAVGVLCWGWVIYVVAIGKLAELAQPFWIAWSWTELFRILMNLSSVTLAGLAAGSWLWHRRPLSSDLWRLVVVPSLSVCAAALAVSLYQPLILGRYFIVLAPAVALLTADVVVKAWDVAARLFSARARYAIVGLVVVLLTAENVTWMRRQKWGPYQNYRAVAEFVIQDAAAAGDDPLVVSIVLPSSRPPVGTLEQHYFKRAGQKANRLRVQLIEPGELAQRAAESHYLIAMHRPVNVAQVRRYVAGTPGFVEIDIPTSCKSMTFLAKRTGIASGSGASNNLSSAGGVRLAS